MITDVSVGKKKTVSDNDVMRERKSRGKEDAHLPALFDYLQRTESEQVQRANEKGKKKRNFEIHRVVFSSFLGVPGKYIHEREKCMSPLIGNVPGPGREEKK